MRDQMKEMSENSSLWAAYKSLRVSSSPLTPTERTAKQYQQYFHTTGKVVHATGAKFERFSLTDPNIQTVLACTTQPVR